MFYKRCPKCTKTFETQKKTKKFCCRSCSNSYTTTARRIPDESIFKNGIDKVNAYILGLIYSDGCLSFDAHSHRYKITISLNDIDLMENIHQLMTPNKKLYKYKHPRGRDFSYSIVSSNEDDVDFLRNIGITQRKSTSICFPDIRGEYMAHFVRGYFDGDGSVYVNNTKTNYNNIIKQYSYVNASFTTGSLIFAEKLSLLLNNYNIKAHLVKDSREGHNSWYVKIYGKQSVKTFYEWIYDDADLFLERKKLKFIEMI